MTDELKHHGIKGQKWGVRRFQNEDRTWTEAGKERYNDGPGGANSEKKESGGSAKTSSSAEKSKKELTPEELAEQAARRKEIAKKVAMGVGIAAAVVGTAVVAKYAGDRISDLNAINSDQFKGLLQSSMQLEFQSIDPHRTEGMEKEGLIKRSKKSGLSGVLERTSSNHSILSPAQLKIADDYESGKIDRQKKHVYDVVNGAVDTYFTKQLSEGETVKVGRYGSRTMTSKEVEQARQFANTYADYLARDYGDNIQNEYLTDVARDFISARLRERAA